MDEQRKWFLGTESTSGEDAGNIVEMTTENLENYMNLTDKAVVECEKMNSNSEKDSTVGKILSNRITCCYTEIICERKSHLVRQPHCCLILRNCHSHPNLPIHHLHQAAAINIKVRPPPSKKDWTR